MVKAFVANENGKIELTEAELNRVLLDTFEEGVIRGRHEGRIEEKMKQLDEKMEELKKQKSSTITTPNFPSTELPIIWTTQPSDASKISQTELTTSIGDPITMKYPNPNISIDDKCEFVTGTTIAKPKEKKKNGRK